MDEEKLELLLSFDELEEELLEELEELLEDLLLLED